MVKLFEELRDGIMGLIVGSFIHDEADKWANVFQWQPFALNHLLHLDEFAASVLERKDDVR